MTSLVLGLALTTPAQPPYYPAPFPPGVRPQPQVMPARPVGPAFHPPVPLPPPGPVGTPVLTLEQFSRAFTPVAGKHHVLLVHPKTRQPVPVCFTLPNCGKMTRFEVGRDWIEFEFDKPDLDIEINFLKNGRVEVEYDD